MNPIKRTAGWTIARFRGLGISFHGGRDMARRYHLLSRLSNIRFARRRLLRHGMPRAAFS